MVGDHSADERGNPRLHEISSSGPFICTIHIRKEGNVLFNDELNTFYLRLYGVRHMVKDH